MKKILSFGLLLPALFSCYSATDVPVGWKVRERQYYPSGKLRSQYLDSTDGEHTRMITYFESGARQSDKNFAGGSEGPSTLYLEDGTVALYCFYKNHQPEGRMYAYYDRKHLAFEKFYKDGYKTGTWKYYNEEGSLKAEETYQEGLSTDYGNDFSNNKYFYKGRVAFTTAVRNGKEQDTVILDQQGYKALQPIQPIQPKEQPSGKALFKANCAMCHHPVKDATGPMMRGVTGKRDKEWLVKMITNAPALIESGDKTANELYTRWNKTPHPDYTDRLSRDEVLQIIGYLETIP